MDTEKEVKTTFPWRALLCSCLLLGGGQGILINTLGLFTHPVCTAHGFGVGAFSVQMSISALAMMVGFASAGKVMEKFNIKALLLLCTMVQVGVFVLYAQMTQLWMFYIASILRGLACVIPSYMIGPLIISNWFEKKRGLAMGIAMSCNGIFGAVFSIAGGKLIAAIGYQGAYVILGGGAALLMIPAALLCVPHPSMSGKRTYGAEPDGEQTKENFSERQTGIPKAQAIRSIPFLLLFVTVSVIVCAAAFVPQISVFAVAKGFQIDQAGSFVGVFMVGSLLGSFLLGWLNDRVGIRNCTVIALVAGALAIVLLVISATSVLFLVAGLALLGVAAASAGVQPPLIIGDFFGQKDYAAIYGVMQIAISLGTVVATPVYGFVFDTTGNFNPALIAVAAALAACTPMTILAFRKKRPMPITKLC